MRATLARVGQISSSVGAIKLRMSVGVHSGPVHLFRVGGSHKELLIAGPGPTGVVEMEQFATAGQIVVSPGTASRIAPALVGEPAGPGYFLKSRPRAQSFEAFPPATGAEVNLRVGVPVALRHHLGGSIEPEHRHVTVAFIRYDGIDGIIAMDGPVAAAAALDELMRAVQIRSRRPGRDVPRHRRRQGRRQDHRGGRRAVEPRRRRRPRPAGHAPRDRNRVPARHSHRRQSGPRLRRRHRPRVPADLHDHG